MEKVNSYVNSYTYEEFRCRKVYIKVIYTHTRTHIVLGFLLLLFFGDSNKTLNQASAKLKPIEVNIPRTK